VVDGFTIQGGSGNYSSAVFIHSSSPTIQNCQINTTFSIPTNYGISAYSNSDPIIQDNRIYAGGNTSFSVAMDVTGTSDPIIRRNYIKAGDNTNSKGIMCQNTSSPS
jgi:hypothetical protein